MKSISPDQLREVMTANPDANQKTLASLCSLSLSAFNKKIKGGELRAIYDELKGDRHRKRGTSPRASKSSKQTNGATPPGNGSAKGVISDELLRKVKLEFEHITLFDEKTQHFDEIAAELRAIK
jgi:hypothetical protein